VFISRRRAHSDVLHQRSKDRTAHKETLQLQSINGCSRCLMMDYPVFQSVGFTPHPTPLYVNPRARIAWGVFLAAVFQLRFYHPTIWRHVMCLFNRDVTSHYVSVGRETVPTGRKLEGPHLSILGCIFRSNVIRNMKGVHFWCTFSKVFKFLA